MTNLIFTGYEWGIDFYNAAGDIIHTDTYTDEKEFDAAFDNPQWPDDTAVRLDSWKRPCYRLPVMGVDYGPGSVSRRFGGYVPRSAYEKGAG